MDISVFESKVAMSEAAARHAATAIRNAIAGSGKARIVVATGASMFDFLDALTRLEEVDWTSVEMFHLDEYIGLPPDHPAGFGKYLMDRLISKTGLKNYHLIDGNGDPEFVCELLGGKILSAPIDLAIVGIGENGHLAFNDPPADFETDVPYRVVELDDACRRQQLGEGWFNTLDEVPKRAISMSIRQILKAEKILCLVPEERKASAVKRCLEGDISPDSPASILRTHPNTTIYLDGESCSLLSTIVE